MNELTRITPEALGVVTLNRVPVLTKEIVFAPGNLEKIIAAVECDVRATKRDISTEVGRKAIASLALTVAKSKKALDDMGKVQTDALRKQADVIQADRNIITSRFDALRAEVEQPLKEYKAKQQARIDAHEAAIAAIEAAAVFHTEPTAAEIAERVASIRELHARDWEEFADRASTAWATTKDKIVAKHAEVVRLEAERVELETLRREKAERDRVAAHRQALDAIMEAPAFYTTEQPASDFAQRLGYLRRYPKRDWEEFADEAASVLADEIEKTEAAMDQATLREAVARAEREAEIAAQADERARLAAAEEAERVRLDAERVTREHQAALDRAEADRAAAERKAEADRDAAAEEAERASAAAVEAERKRVADEQAAAQREEERRTADKKHRGTINAAAMKAIVGLGLTEDQAKGVVTAIALGKVPAITIRY